MSISVTSLSAYEYCRRKLYLERVFNIREPMKEPTILGSIRHRVIDLINKDESKIVKSIQKHHTDKDIIEKYSSEFLKLLKKELVNRKAELDKLNLDQLETYKKIKNLVLQESEIRAQNVVDFVKKARLFGEELWEKLTPKIESEYYLESEKLGLKGIIDHIEVYEDILVPVEMKTGSAPREGAWENHKIQLGAYILMLAEKKNKPISKGYIRYLDIAENRNVVMNPFLRLKIEELVKKVNDCLSSKELPEFCDNPNKCKSCGIREQCYNKEMMDGLMQKLSA
jgi:CRISPR-associated protein Cas4